MNFLFFILAVVLAPLLPGIVNQTKAFFAGRRGPGFFRLYFDLWKLLRKSCPRSTTSTWLFDLAPAISLAATLVAGMIFPWTLDTATTLSGISAVLFFYLLGTGRFFTVLGALDTGSAFEGMGASREVQFSALVEPIVFVILGFLVLATGQTSLAGLLAGYDAGAWAHHSISLVLAVLAFFAVLLSECCRVPFDDPETHLELTMIHEAMILDNAGPDLAFILYGAAFKMMLLAAFLVALLLPALPLAAPAKAALLLASTLGVAVLVGIVESVIARMRFLKTPQVLSGALMVAILATLLFVLF
ncbi:MAG: NADH-quinone oxidoreductase subunit H [Kiritimatiellae bacterium]|nr:NADH-quinone oxidoreductase subunit H [Kiritimatiellia bacterium]